MVQNTLLVIFKKSLIFVMAKSSLSDSINQIYTFQILGKRLWDNKALLVANIT